MQRLTFGCTGADIDKKCRQYAVLVLRGGAKCARWKKLLPFIPFLFFFVFLFFCFFCFCVYFFVFLFFFRFFKRWSKVRSLEKAFTVYSFGFSVFVFVFLWF